MDFTIFIVLFSWLLILYFFSNIEKTKFLDISESIIFKHRHNLYVQKIRSTKTDQYGNKNLDNWYHKEIPYFCETVLKAQLPRYRRYKKNIYDLIDNIIKGYQQDIEHENPYDEGMTGTEYERYCERLLQKNGWITQTTPTTGDQGVDLIAEKNNRRIVIQCKRFKSSVGNKAVQEAYAGKNFYKADHALVVSNAPFSRAAQQLALSNGIILIHHSLLATPDFDEKIFSLQK